jgi:formylglycine-generating enzyme required for sulfatase activity
MLAPSHAGIITFGTGANTFQMEFVTIGNPGNPADTTGTPNPAGSVGYEYGIGKYEVSEGMINRFNASQSLQIITNNRGTNKPATGVSWNEAARFINWLNTSSGGFAAYKFTTGGVNDGISLWTTSDTLDYDATNPYRSKRTTFALPNFNEWYKAAYYDPFNTVYYNYATGSDTVPISVASGTTSGTAVYNGLLGPADVTQAGGLSPYGVMGLGGNAWDWEENSTDFLNNTSSANRGIRGGSWVHGPVELRANWRNNLPANAKTADGNVGFRVAMVGTSRSAVPEPSTMVIGTMLGLWGILGKRRMTK